MALFDNDFIETIVTEGKDCDKDCKKDKDVDDEKDEKDEDDVDDEDVELSDDDKEEAEEAARFDVEEATSIESMKGVTSVVNEMATDAFMACNEMLGLTVALDKIDVACTESYNKTNLVSERAVVTEQFKDTVKKYAQKFKAFILKVKNIIVRAYNRVKNYAVNFMTKVITKIKTRKVTSLDTEAMAKSDKKYKTFANVTKDFASLAERVEKYMSEQTGFSVIAQKAIDLKPDTSAEDCDAILKQISEASAPSKDQIRTAILGQQVEVSASDFKDALSQINSVGVMKKDPFAGYQKWVMDVIKRTESSVFKAKDVNSKVMSVKVALINRAVTYANRVWAVLGTLLHHWVSVRVSVIGTFGKGAAKQEPDTSSWTLLDQFGAEW